MSNSALPTFITFTGVDVYMTPDPRRYGELPADVCVPAAFRAEFNAWSARFFPPDPALNLLEDGQTIMIGDRRAHMNPRTYARLKAALAKDSPR